eukprot:NODE_26574_length_546_cov_1.491647.p5 GENE.NODE_26574_length_546_cov_1.491647~~NODE_26574_length_546_cov_1.491647.p5  ORF type:complete len:65 (-),score=30.43 NODE_26574_length_546_cov_1.491647:130-324(-)
MSPRGGFGFCGDAGLDALLSQTTPCLAPTQAEFAIRQKKKKKKKKKNSVGWFFFQLHKNKKKKK